MMSLTFPVKIKLYPKVYTGKRNTTSTIASTIVSVGNISSLGSP